MRSDFLEFSLASISRSGIRPVFGGHMNERPIQAAVYFRWTIASDELLERLLCSP
jgi:hypothetical protein